MVYKLGKDGKYRLTEEALKHIIEGDFSERQDKDEFGKSSLTKIIAGGLHTFSAWNSFLLLRPDITHGLLIDSTSYEKWYYARQLQNEIILLKIPRDCFQSKAANLTKFPQTFYKSGYLWKTLFPVKFTKEQIISTIDDALNNIFIEESTDNLIIGYSNKDDFFKSIKIRVQVRGTDIMSAFPTWEQPMTGNNGKPFSHIDSINTVISGSTIFGTNHYELYLSNTIGKWNDRSIAYLIEKTPSIITDRETPKKDISRKKQLEKRLDELVAYGETLDEQQVKEIVELCLRDEYSRNSIDFLRFLYNEESKEIKTRLKIRNTVSLYQNFQEYLNIINAYDLKNSKQYTLMVINNILKVRFIRTGGLDQWELKRLSNLICKIIISYDNSKITLDFITLLSKSPLRIAFYCEFNLNSYFLPDPALIGLTENENLALNETHFYDFVAQNLGINYTTNFDDDFNIKLAKHIQIEDHNNGHKIVSDLVNHAIGSDFNYFAISLIDLCKILTIDEQSVTIIEEVIFDYHRCIAANILRVLAKHKKLLTRQLEYGDKDFIKFTKAKHEYKFLWFLNRIMIEQVSELYKANGFVNEALKLEERYLSLYEEVMKIPMPKSVPKYLKSDER